jgi:non-ribosomal peptide synthetase component F
LLSGLALALQRLTGMNDFCLGAFFANRSREDYSDVVGCFINQLPLRMNFSRIRTPSELVQHARSVMRAAQEHSELPLALLIDHLKIAPFHPALQVAIVFHTELGNLARLPARLGQELEVEVLEGHNRVAKRDCTYHIWATGDCLEGVLVYDADLFDPETAQSMVDGCLRALTDLANEQEDRVCTGSH